MLDLIPQNTRNIFYEWDVSLIFRKSMVVSLKCERSTTVASEPDPVTYTLIVLFVTESLSDVLNTTAWM